MGGVNPLPSGETATSEDTPLFIENPDLDDSAKSEGEVGDNFDPARLFDE